jgi:hypothetical protein
MTYALLAYSRGERRPTDEIHPAIAAVLQRPDVTGWVRLQSAESATTVKLEAQKTLLTDGPFVDSKEFLGGLILVEAEDLDGALAVAAELQELGFTAAIGSDPCSSRGSRVLEEIFRDNSTPATGTQAYKLELTQGSPAPSAAPGNVSGGGVGRPRRCRSSIR